MSEHRSRFFGGDEAPRQTGTVMDLFRGGERYHRDQRRGYAPGPSPNMRPRGGGGGWNINWTMMTAWLAITGVIFVVAKPYIWPAPLERAAETPPRVVADAAPLAPAPQTAVSAKPASPEVARTQELPRPVVDPQATGQPPATPAADHGDAWFFLPTLPKASNGDDMKPSGCAHWMHTPNCVGKRPTYSGVLPGIGDMEMAMHHHDSDVQQGDTQIEITPPQASPVPRQPRYHSVNCRAGLHLNGDGVCVGTVRAWCPRGNYYYNAQVREPPLTDQAGEESGLRGPPDQEYGEPPRTYEAVERYQEEPPPRPIHRTVDGYISGSPCADPRARHGYWGGCIYDHSRD